MSSLPNAVIKTKNNTTVYRSLIVNIINLQITTIIATNMLYV